MLATTTPTPHFSMCTNHHEIVWTIVPDRTPYVQRNCPKCERPREFYNSGKFRINAQQKTLDVWLIYKCTSCDATWNCNILRRILSSSIDAELYRRFLTNDSRTSWEYAFNYELLKRNGADVDPAVGYHVDGEDVDLSDPSIEKISIRVTFEFRVDVRLDTLLANKLGLSRRTIAVLFERGAISILSGTVKDLKKKLKGEVLLAIDSSKAVSILASRPGAAEANDTDADGTGEEGECSAGENRRRETDHVASESPSGRGRR